VLNVGFGKDKAVRSFDNLAGRRGGGESVLAALSGELISGDFGLCDDRGGMGGIVTGFRVGGDG
jgi:hypothetical protein